MGFAAFLFLPFDEGSLTSRVVCSLSYIIAAQRNTFGDAKRHFCFEEEKLLTQRYSPHRARPACTLVFKCFLCFLFNVTIMEYFLMSDVHPTC